MWEKEKLLVTSNFSFSHIVFKRLVLQTRKNQGLFGKRLNLYLILMNKISLNLSQTVCRQKFSNLIKMVESSPKG